MHNKMKQCLDDLIVATKILVNEQVIDGFGHVSVRNPEQSDNHEPVKEAETASVLALNKVFAGDVKSDVKA